MRPSRSGFTLAELLVSVAVLTIIVLLTSRLFNRAAHLVTLGGRKLEADSETRLVLDRMNSDFAQMVRRPDVDYHVKSSLALEAGNDQIAFFCNAPGYYPSTGSQSSLSLVSYRVNSDGSTSSFSRLERMGKGLLWCGVSTTNTPLLFGLQAIANNWPNAVDNSSIDADYELIGPQIFRFEYYYVLNTGEVSDQPGANGFQDIVAISVAVAAIDPKSRGLLSDSQVTTLISRLKDFDPSLPASDLTTSWQSTLNSINDMPRPGINGVRIYQRSFLLKP